MVLATIRQFRDHRGGGMDVETAPLGILLVIATGDPYRVGIGDRPPITAMGGFVVGPQSRYGSSALSGVAEGVQVDLSWSVAAAVFGPELRHFADQAIAVTDLVGGAQLVDRLSETPAADQARLVESWLHDRSRNQPGPSPLTERALQRIEAGASLVHCLAAELSCSRGHLHRTVRAATGQSPTTLIRIARLHRMLARQKERTLADLAAAAGYVDHAHLCHETRQLAGRTPRELFAPQVT